MTQQAGNRWRFVIAALVMQLCLGALYGAKNVGANYGIMFTAYGLTGYFVPGYFAGIMDAARESGDLAAGYNQVYLTLAVFAVIGAVLALVVRKPVHGS